MAIPARLSLVTLGVRDVARSTIFYEALGWRRSSASQAGEVSFFHTDGGLLALYGADNLAADARISNDYRGGFRQWSLSMNLDSVGDVDAATAEFLAAGGSMVSPPEATAWGGYSGYVADPDGHLWEIAHNPLWPTGGDGRPTLPK